MRIAVFGAGALGSLYGGLLSENHDVTLVGRQEHVDAVNVNGLHISGLMKGVHRPKARTAAEGLDIQDMVLVTVKAYDTRTAAREVESIVGEGTAVVSLQNGLGNSEILVRAFGSRVIIGVPFMGVTFSRPGHIYLAGLGETVLGSPSGQHGLAMKVSETLSAVRLPTRVSANIGPEIWMKATVNASINPITALVRRENGCICQQRELQELSRAVCQECVRAAEANGIALGRGDPFEKVLEVARMTARNRSSMLQDVERGKRTEIDAINGSLAEAGESHGVSMPVNRALWSLVRSLWFQSN